MSTRLLFLRCPLVYRGPRYPRGSLPFVPSHGRFYHARSDRGGLQGELRWGTPDPRQ
jgi:hypothetical protein